MLSVEEAMADGAPLLHEDCKGKNISITRKIAYGDMDGGFAEADYVREDVFTLQPVSHAYLEPCSSLAAPDEGGRVSLWTSTQAPISCSAFWPPPWGFPKTRCG